MKFLHKVITFFWRKNSREAILNFLLKMLSGETLCKFYQIFPPKVLVYIFEQNFLDTFINYLMEINLTNKRIERIKTCNITI